jgi:excisionase family DNA binding protein
MTTRFFTEAEVAEHTQISLGTLRRWRLENKGPRYFKFGSLVRYPEDDLAAWESSRPAGGDGSQRIAPVSAKRSVPVQKAGLRG